MHADARARAFSMSSLSWGVMKRCFAGGGFSSSMTLATQIISLHSQISSANASKETICAVLSSSSHERIRCQSLRKRSWRSSVSRPGLSGLRLELFKSSRDLRGSSAHAGSSSLHSQSLSVSASKSSANSALLFLPLSRRLYDHEVTDVVPRRRLLPGLYLLRAVGLAAHVLETRHEKLPCPVVVR
jgi:hypothetical protein